MRMAQEGFEPSASLVLSESGLPVAYRAGEISSGGWNRTSGLHVQSVASLPAATAPESSIREGGFEPPPPDSKSGSLPVSRFPSKAEGEGVEPPRLIARPISSRVPSPIGLPFLSVYLATSRDAREFEHRREESNLQSSP